MNQGQHRYCDRCGERWAVSPQVLKQKEYYCPRCRAQMEKERRERESKRGDRRYDL